MVRIITDTTACIDLEYAKQHQIPVIPQIVTFGDQSFYEGIELDNSAFMDRLRKSSALPKTAAPPPELFRREFEKLVPSGEPILCLHPSIEVSGTVRSAVVAAQDFPSADIRIIDTRILAAPLLVLVKLAVTWAEAGEDIDTIEARIQRTDSPLQDLLSGRYAGVSGQRRKDWRRLGPAGDDPPDQTDPDCD